MASVNLDPGLLEPFATRPHEGTQTHCPKGTPKKATPKPPKAPLCPGHSTDSFQPFDTLNIRIFESPFLSGAKVQAEDPTRNPHREAEIRPAELSAVKSELAGKYLVPKCPDRALSTRLSFPRGASEGEYPSGGHEDPGRFWPPATDIHQPHTLRHRAPPFLKSILHFHNFEL
jgi:hypothetical protein